MNKTKVKVEKENANLVPLGVKKERGVSALGVVENNNNFKIKREFFEPTSENISNLECWPPQNLKGSVEPLLPWICVSEPRNDFELTDNVSEIKTKPKSDDEVEFLFENEMSRKTAFCVAQYVSMFSDGETENKSESDSEIVYMDRAMVRVKKRRRLRQKSPTHKYKQPHRQTHLYSRF